MQELPDFIPPLFGELAALPAELANEPYSFYDDKLRPEIIRRRQRFEYRIVDDGVECYVGDRRTSWTQYDLGLLRHGRNIDKISSNVSVIAVYDRYGIPGAYTYLKHLYERKYYADYPAFLYIYLEGSLMVLRPDFKTTQEVRDGGIAYILNLCSQLLLELVALDAKQPKMLGELRPVRKGTLPPDVLALITGSQRLSKPISDRVRAEKCAETLTRDELWNRDSDIDKKTYSFANRDGGGYVLSTDSENWQLTRDEEVFTLARGRGPSLLNIRREREPEQFSLGDYEQAYQRKGCNVNRQMREMMTALLRRFSIATQSNLKDVLPWVVQLSYDTGMGKPGEFTGLYELGAELHRLLRAAIDLYPVEND